MTHCARRLGLGHHKPQGLTQSSDVVAKLAVTSHLFLVIKPQRPERQPDRSAAIRSEGFQNSLLTSLQFHLMIELRITFLVLRLVVFRGAR